MGTRTEKFQRYDVYYDNPIDKGARIRTTRDDNGPFVMHDDVVKHNEEFVTIEIPKKNANDIACILQSIIESAGEFCAEDEEDETVIKIINSIPDKIRKLNK